MNMPVISAEVAGALGRFFTGGDGPTHATLTSIFRLSGFADADPYDSRLQTPNKQTRVLTVAEAAVRSPARAPEFLKSLIAELRATGCFDPSLPAYQRRRVDELRNVLTRCGWSLTDDGQVQPVGLGVFAGSTTRPVIDAHLERLRRANDDSAALIGGAKDLLESVAKLVIEALDQPTDGEFGPLWSRARTLLSVHPRDLPAEGAQAEPIRKICGAIWTIADQVNVLRNSYGTGHGRTAPSEISPEMGRLVARQACEVAQFMLAALDRQQDDARRSIG